MNVVIANQIIPQCLKNVVVQPFVLHYKVLIVLNVRFPGVGIYSLSLFQLTSLPNHTFDSEGNLSNIGAQLLHTLGL